MTVYANDILSNFQCFIIELGLFHHSPNLGDEDRPEEEHRDDFEGILRRLY